MQCSCVGWRPAQRRILPSVVKLNQPPLRQVVLGFKGVLDFYSWKGQICVRRWPRSPTQPRSAAVQAQYSDFKTVTQGFKTIEESAMGGLIGMTSGTQLVPKDMQVQLYYGHAVTEANGPFPLIPPPGGDQETMLEIDLSTAPSIAEQTLLVGSTSYQTLPSLMATADFSVTSYTHFRIVIRGRSSTNAQAITAQLSKQAAPLAPLSAAGNDLVVNRPAAVYDSGWKAFSPVILVDTPLQLSLKGSNGTVNLLHNGVRLMLKYQAP